MQLVFFRLHLILHARIARFDVMSTVALFGKSFRELNKGLVFLQSKNQQDTFKKKLRLNKCGKYKMELDIVLIIV